MVTAQQTALTNEQTALTIRQNRFTATVALIRALGGGWQACRRRSAQSIRVSERDPAAFDFDEQPSLDPKQVRELAACRWWPTVMRCSCWGRPAQANNYGKVLKTELRAAAGGELAHLAVVLGRGRLSLSHRRGAPTPFQLGPAGPDDDHLLLDSLWRLRAQEPVHSPPRNGEFDAGSTRRSSTPCWHGLSARPRR